MREYADADELWLRVSDTAIRDEKDEARTVGSFGFDGLAVGRDEFTGHHAKAAEALGENIRLHITVVVLACPNEPARRLDCLCNHVVDQAVFVVDRSLVEEGPVMPAPVKLERVRAEEL